MSTRYVNPSKATWNETVDRLRAIFDAWGIPHEDYRVTTGTEPRQRNSEWYGGWAMVEYRPPGSPNMVKMFLDSQSSPAKNLSAIAITIEGIRMQERRGLGGIAAAHYLALAAPRTERDPYEVLGVRSDAPIEVLEASWKARARTLHPDAGGNEDDFKELGAAWERIKADRGVAP